MKIEKGIPVRKRKQKRADLGTLLKTLKPGESILLEQKNYASKVSLYGVVTTLIRNNTDKTTSFTWDWEGNKGARIWKLPNKKPS